MSTTEPCCSESSNDFVFPPDHETTPFAVTSRVLESHRSSIYAIQFNNYLPEDDLPVFATAGEQQVNIYRCQDDKEVKLLCSFTDVSKDEAFYALSWCYDTLEAKRGMNPYFIAVGGENNYIRILDASIGKCIQVLRGHGRSINEIRTSPADTRLIASASRDITVQVWHIRNDCPLMVIGGSSGHMDQILSLDWSECGSFIATCSNDHTIKLWSLDLKKNKMRSLIENLEKNGKNSLTKLYRSHHWDLYDTTGGVKLFDLPMVPPVNALQNCSPVRIDKSIASIDDLHTDYVDCVRFFGEYCISKGSGSDPYLTLFRFGMFNETLREVDRNNAQSCAIRLFQKHIPGATNWFVKLGVDPQNKWILCGNATGTLYGYDLAKGFEGMEPDLEIKVCETAIRQVEFGAQGKVVIAVGDGGHITRLDRVFKGGKLPPKLDPIAIVQTGFVSRLRKKRGPSEKVKVDSAPAMAVDAEEFTESEDSESDE